MSDSPSEKLIYVKELISEFRIEEALQITKEIEKIEYLTPEEILMTLAYSANIHYYLGQFEILLRIAEQLYQKSQVMNMPLFSLDALHYKGRALHLQGKLKEMGEIIEQHEKIFNSIPEEESLEYKERKAILLIMKSHKEFYEGAYDLALEHQKKSLAIFQEVNPNSSYILGIYVMMPHPLTAKGELNQALKANEKALSLTPEREIFYIGLVNSMIYQSMGNIYFEKGNFKSAFDYHSRVLENHRKYNFLTWMHVPFLNIIKVLVAQNKLIQAKNYLEQFKQHNEVTQTQLGAYSFQFARALILKSGSRMQEHVEAQNILKDLVNKFPDQNSAIILLCDIYFDEFKIFNQMDILNDIQPLIGQLLKNAKLENSYSLLANVKLLEAKLALLQINMVDARKFLTEAQKIANEHDLELLASEISKEHDHLLEELKLWESFRKEQSSVAERLKLVSIDNILERMQGKREIEIPEIHVEEPIFLLIMDKGGITYFNYSFISDWDFDDLFSSFMSAFNSFSAEIFSKSIDRVKIGDTTILVNPIKPYLACYVIKGQSYPAQQKLSRFSETIKSTGEIWDALNKAAKTSEMLELDNPPCLGNIVNKIFFN